MQQNESLSSVKTSFPAITPHHNVGALRKQKKMMVRVVPIFLLLAMVFPFMFLAKDVFIVKSVVCAYENGKECPEAVLAELSRLKTQSMFFLHMEDQKKKIIAGVSGIDSLSEKKKYPSTLFITLHRSSESFVLYSQKTGEYVLVNDSGKVMQRAGDRPEGLAIIRVDEEYPVGSMLPPTLFQTGRILSEALLTGVLRNSELTYTDEHTIQARLPQNITIYLSSDNIETQLSTLQLLLNEATMIEKASSIDLRFAHPVIR